jgi:hypothetical protein
MKYIIIDVHNKELKMTHDPRGLAAREILLAQLPNTQPRIPCHHSPLEVRGVSVHEVGIVDAHSERPILFSEGAGPCVIMTLRNPQTSETALAHLDTLSDLNSLTEVFETLQHGSVVTLEAHLRGGNLHSESVYLIAELIELLAEKGVHIASSYLMPLDGPEDGESLAIDARTGQICSEINTEEQILLLLADEDDDGDDDVELDEAALILLVDAANEEYIAFTYGADIYARIQSFAERGAPQIAFPLDLAFDDRHLDSCWSGAANDYFAPYHTENECPV